MSFDMNPADEDPHGECRHEILSLNEQLSQERHQVDVYRQQMAEAEKRAADLRIACQSFASELLSVRKENTDEWMQYAAGAFNDLCDVLGMGDRFEYDGRDRLRKVTT